MTSEKLDELIKKIQNKDVILAQDIIDSISTEKEVKN